MNYKARSQTRPIAAMATTEHEVPESGTTPGTMEAITAELNGIDKGEAGQSTEHRQEERASKATASFVGLSASGRSVAVDQ